MCLQDENIKLLMCHLHKDQSREEISQHSSFNDQVSNPKYISTYINSQRKSLIFSVLKMSLYILL